jgi:tetratricopeptide (TPR) repeat protein
MSLADAMGDAELFARGALAFASLFTFGLVLGENVDVLSRALAKLPPADSSIRANVMARLAAAQQPAADIRAPIELAYQAIAMARRCNEPRTLLQALRSGLSAMVDLAPVQERGPLNREMLDLARAQHERGAELRARIRLVFDCMELWQLKEADEHVRACEEIAKRSGHPSYAWNACSLRAMTSLLYGRFAQAHELREQALAWGAKVGDWNSLHSNAMQALWASAMSDDWTAALGAQSRAVELLSATPLWVGWAHFVYQTLMLRRGRPSDRSLLERHSGMLESLMSASENSAIIADGMCAIASREQLEQCVQRLEPFAGHLLPTGPTMMYVDAPYGRALAVLHEHLGRPDRADHHMQQAISAVDTHGLLCHQVDLRIEHAQRLMARDTPSARALAQPLLERAYELARPAAVPAWIARIDALS